MAATERVHLGISVVCDCLIHECRKIIEKETSVVIFWASGSGLPEDNTPVPKHVGVDTTKCIYYLHFIVF